MSFFASDTKGDLARNYGAIARDCYGYQVAVVDLRNPTRSDGYNLLTLINHYMDVCWKDPTNLAARAKAEKYAKILSKTIINPDGENFAQNQYFYDVIQYFYNVILRNLTKLVNVLPADGLLSISSPLLRIPNRQIHYHHCIVRLIAAPPGHTPSPEAPANGSPQSFPSPGASVPSRQNPRSVPV